MVEEMLAARGIVVSHEPARQWALKFGQSYSNQIRRCLPAPGANGILMVCHEHISEGGDVELYKR
jgi:hypothetical protein